MIAPMSATNAIAESEYTSFVNAIADLMDRGRALGLWRTTDELHRALNTARGEIWEAIPRAPVLVTLIVGPIETQPPVRERS
jgi:hypothetical protein